MYVLVFNRWSLLKKLNFVRLIKENLIKVRNLVNCLNFVFFFYILFVIDGLGNFIIFDNE